MRGGKISKSSSKPTASTLSKAISDLESKVDTIATTILATDEFARVANTASSLSVRLKKGLAGQMGSRMALLNVPSRDDVVALGERLMLMDERLVRIEKALSRLVPPDPAAKPAGPPRTRKPTARSASQTSPDRQKQKPATEKKPS
jgi:hypothetical protein